MAQYTDMSHENKQVRTHLLIILALSENLRSHVHEGPSLVRKVKGLHFLQVQICSASPLAGFWMAARVCHGVRQSLFQVLAAALLQPYL